MRLSGAPASKVSNDPLPLPPSCPKGLPPKVYNASKLSRNSEQAHLLHNARQTTETDRGKTRDAEYKVT